MPHTHVGDDSPLKCTLVVVATAFAEVGEILAHEAGIACLIRLAQLRLFRGTPQLRTLASLRAVQVPPPCPPLPVTMATVGPVVVVHADVGLAYMHEARIWRRARVRGWLANRFPFIVCALSKAIVANAAERMPPARCGEALVAGSLCDAVGGGFAVGHDLRAFVQTFTRISRAGGRGRPRCWGCISGSIRWGERRWSRDSFLDAGRQIRPIIPTRGFAHAVVRPISIVTTFVAVVHRLTDFGVGTASIGGFAKLRGSPFTDGPANSVTRASVRTVASVYALVAGELGPAWRIVITGIRGGNTRDDVAERIGSPVRPAFTSTLAHMGPITIVIANVAQHVRGALRVLATGRGGRQTSLSIRPDLPSRSSTCTVVSTVSSVITDITRYRL